MKKIVLATFAILALVTSQAQAAPLTGSYVTDGDTTGTGPWTLTATPSTYSFLALVLDSPLAFSDLTEFSVDFDSIAGGGGGGSPRGRVLLDYDGSGGISAGDRSITVHLGGSPDFVDTPAELDAWSGVNYIGNNDAGRYDTSSFLGGSPFTNYLTAATLLGAYDVLRLGVVMDLFRPFEDQELVITSINGASLGDTAAVPEPASMFLLGSGIVGLVARARRRRSQQQT